MHFVILATLTIVRAIALPLPAHEIIPSALTGVESSGARDPMSTGGHAVAATIMLAGNWKSTVIYWRGGARIELPPLAQSGTNSRSRFLAGAAVAPNGALFATSAEPFSGAYSGIWYDNMRLTGSGWEDITATCEPNNRTAHIEKVEADGTLDVTQESPELIAFDNVQTGVYAPHALRISNGTCTELGRFNLRDTNGPFAVGFRGYLGHALAPTNLNIAQQRFVAVRYSRGTLRELGPGEAFAVANDGAVVGSDAPTLISKFMTSTTVTDSARTHTESHTYSCCTPHAVLWKPDGTSQQLTPAGTISVAYAIDSKHRIIGTLIGRDKRHYAFIWDGRLHLLDEMRHEPGWRFEGAYRFAIDGAIVGAATHNGSPAVFQAYLSS